jgi:hypothetical protein
LPSIILSATAKIDLAADHKYSRPYHVFAQLRYKGNKVSPTRRDLLIGSAIELRHVFTLEACGSLCLRVRAVIRLIVLLCIVASSSAGDSVLLNPASIDDPASQVLA